MAEPTAGCGVLLSRMQLDAAGCTLALTADHGMKGKHDRDGAPDVIDLQSLLDDWLGPGAAGVILPIMPSVLSRPLRAEVGAPLHNYDILDLASNQVA